MPVIMQEPPAATVAALDQALTRFTAETVRPAEAAEAAPAVSVRPTIVARSPVIASGIRAWTGRAVAAARPPAAPVVVMGLDELAEGKSPRAAKAVMWAQFLDGSTDAPVIADVEAGTNRFLAVSEGPAIAAMRRNITDVLAKEGTEPAARELSMIRVPALHLSAVWLKGQAGEADDIVIPNPGPIAPLEAGKRYSLAEFQRITRDMAADRLRQAGPETGG